MTNLPFDPSANSVKVKLLSYLTQELLSPLTSVLGMTSVLSQEIYGPLTKKQKEYLDIINDSSRQLRSLVEEIVMLAEFDSTTQALQRTAVDIESLCQQAIGSLVQFATKREQEMHLSFGLASIEGRNQGERIWLLDKDKVQQMLHQILVSVIQSADAGSTIRIHLFRREEELNIAIWLSHPWLGDSLPHAKLYSNLLSDMTNRAEARFGWDESSSGSPVRETGLQVPTSTSGSHRFMLSSADLANAIGEGEGTESVGEYSDRERLGLLLCCLLLEMQGGSFSIQGSPDVGYRYLLALPAGSEFASQ